MLKSWLKITLGLDMAWCTYVLLLFQLILALTGLTKYWYCSISRYHTDPTCYLLGIGLILKILVHLSTA